MGLVLLVFLGVDGVLCLLEFVLRGEGVGEGGDGIEEVICTLCSSKKCVLGVASNEVEGNARVEGVEESDEVGEGGAAFSELSIEESGKGIGTVVGVIVIMEKSGCGGDKAFACFTHKGVSEVVAGGDKGILLYPRGVDHGSGRRE